MLHKPRSMQKTHAGFSLIELMIVLVILGLIAGIVGPQAMKYLGKGKSLRARASRPRCRLKISVPHWTCIVSKLAATPPHPKG